MASSLSPLITELLGVHEAIAGVDRECADYLAGIPEAQQASARNLLHYLALRCHDLRDAQPVLAAKGLSSLGRTESHVRHGLEAVLKTLHVLDGTSWETSLDDGSITKDEGEILLAAHTNALFGPPPDGRSVRIMVTMPGDAANDYLLVRDLVRAGMDCMRVNCAHDEAGTWDRMIRHLRRANRELQRSCLLSMDIGGPKLRTSSLEPGPAVIKIKPRRDALGNVTLPALVGITGPAKRMSSFVSLDAVLTLDADLPEGIRPGATIGFDDVRGRSRAFRVRDVKEGACVAELDRTAYVVSGTTLRFTTSGRTVIRRVVDVPPTTSPLLLHKGDTLVLTPEDVPGRPATFDEHDRILVPASIGITLPEVFRDAQPGETVWFDDGKIGGVIRAVDPARIAVEITQARTGGGRLGPAKGVNLPDTHLRIPALTPKDLEDLPFIARHADLIGYSFVRHADDILSLQHHLASLNAESLGIILKIETRHAFAELPKLLLACMRGGRFGVMIARGDLAVECGFERMAEVQEEILWICEAAHTPVIWATQVLESMAKTGMPSRAEVTDAAMSERAECVMLNKGPFICDAVRTLDNILRRMQAHQAKKRAMLRPLHVAHRVLSELSAKSSSESSSREAPVSS
ncbi:MAG TPA: pyruvate kinase [Vicinamibacterales bacterium]|nr:pyruvate kinase [Vicinamibacterales bacterium]